MTLMAGIDRQLLRSVYGSFPVGVTVVTTRGSGGRPWGMTASSFNSISVDPPLVSISIITSTPSHGAFVRGAEFAISVLSAGQADLARKFAMPAEDKFSGVPLEQTPFSSPVLADSAAWLVCEPHQVLEMGDHSLLVGRVLGCRSAGVPPLAYHGGGFYHLTEPDEVLPPSHGTVGFIVEYESRIALARTDHGWSLPTGPLAGGETTTEALRVTAQQLIGTSVEPDFLYSIVDLHEHLACIIYRGRLTQAPAQADGVHWFAADEIPWDSLNPSVLRAVMNRYLKERIADQFGVFVNVGEGRFATLRSETDWPTSQHG
jgi:flavin reductase (DIM6/NTAB) family NADH-FMN oxidoreductase RutF